MVCSGVTHPHSKYQWLSPARHTEPGGYSAEMAWIRLMALRDVSVIVPGNSEIIRAMRLFPRWIDDQDILLFGSAQSAPRILFIANPAVPAIDFKINASRAAILQDIGHQSAHYLSGMGCASGSRSCYLPATSTSTVQVPFLPPGYPAGCFPLPHTLLYPCSPQIPSQYNILPQWQEWVHRKPMISDVETPWDTRGRASLHLSTPDVPGIRIIITKTPPQHHKQFEWNRA